MDAAAEGSDAGKAVLRLLRARRDTRAALCEHEMVGCASRKKGKFDEGWDKLREDIFARQKASASSPVRLN